MIPLPPRLYAKLSLLFLILSLAGCRGNAAPAAQTQEIPPTPQPFLVAHTPALRPMVPALQACAQAQPDIALFVDEIAPSQADSSAYDLVFRLGEQGASGYLAAVAAERLAVIVNPANPAGALERADLRNIYSDESASWKDYQGENEAIHPITYLAGDESRYVFENRLGISKLSGETLLAADPQVMLEMVTKDPAAIGYLPGAFLDESVKAVELNETMQIPVLAQAAAEPQGAGRAFLACMQSKQGQEVLMERYLPWKQP